MGILVGNDSLMQIEFLQEYKLLLSKYYDNINVNKKYKTKLKGSLAANLTKKYIEKVIVSNNLPFAVSDNNVYIEGHAVECDLLIVKQDSKPIFNMPPIYHAKDIQAIIECKATGILIDQKNPKNPFFNELNMLKQLNDDGSSIKFGYVSLAEQITARSQRLIDEANTYINEFVNDDDKDFGVFCFAKTYPEDDYPIYEENPYSFQDYIKHLCSTKI